MGGCPSEMASTPLPDEDVAEDKPQMGKGGRIILRAKTNTAWESHRILE